MSSVKKRRIDLGEALGASRSIPVMTSQLMTPLDVLALREEVAQRIHSTGGRPTDPEWTIQRQVPFRPETWKTLQQMAVDLQASGASASPAQLAALFIEHAVRAISLQKNVKKAANE